MNKDFRAHGRFVALLCLTSACIIDGGSDDDDDGASDSGSSEGGSADASESGSESTDDGAEDSSETATGVDDTSETGVAGPCDDLDEIEPNDTRDEAQSFASDGVLRGCVGNTEDEDWFELTVPSDPAGGVVVVTLTEVGDDRPGFRIQSTTDNGILHTVYSGDPGADLTGYFDAAAGQSYRIVVHDHGLEGGDPYPYTLTTTWHPVVDAYEPNDTRDEAVPITLGETVNGTLFAGFTSAETPHVEPYDDWFSFDLAAGPFVAQLDNVATDARVSLTLFDADNAQVQSDYTGTPGESLTLEVVDDVPAGAYTLRVTQFGLDVPLAAGEGVELPDHATREYDLVVTQ